MSAVKVAGVGLRARPALDTGAESVGTSMLVLFPQENKLRGLAPHPLELDEQGVERAGPRRGGVWGATRLKKQKFGRVGGQNAPERATRFSRIADLEIGDSPTRGWASDQRFRS